MWYWWSSYTLFPAKPPFHAGDFPSFMVHSTSGDPWESNHARKKRAGFDTFIPWPPILDRDWYMSISCVDSQDRMTISRCFPYLTIMGMFDGFFTRAGFEVSPMTSRDPSSCTVLPCWKQQKQLWLGSTFHPIIAYCCKPIYWSWFDIIRNCYRSILIWAKCSMLTMPIVNIFHLILSLTHDMFSGFPLTPLISTLDQ